MSQLSRQSLPVLSNATEIATDRYPLRASSLPKLNECPASVFLSQQFWLREEMDEELGGEPAQTGNLVHSGAAVYHMIHGSVQQRTEAGLAALNDARQKFPGGDPRRATKIFQAYAADPQNQEAEVVRNEQKVVARLPPAPFDPTGQPIVIRGTLDQIRMIDGVPKVMDIKTGKTYYGPKALDHYMTQQAAYVLAAQQTWGHEFEVPIEPGALICTDGYFRAGGHVFWHHKWGVEAITRILQNVVIQVAAARSQLLGFAPSSDHCKWCEHKSFSACQAFMGGHVY